MAIGSCDVRKVNWIHARICMVDRDAPMSSERVVLPCVAFNVSFLTLKYVKEA
jgi:hypothetical protein